LWPVHGVPMLVRRTFGPFQYRYCTAAGCHQTARTVRYIPEPNPAVDAPSQEKSVRPAAPRGPRIDGPTAVGARHVPKPIVNPSIKARLRLNPSRRHRQHLPPNEAHDSAGPTNGSARSFTDPRRPAEEDRAQPGVLPELPLESPSRPPDASAEE